MAGVEFLYLERISGEVKSILTWDEVMAVTWKDLSPWRRLLMEDDRRTS